MKKTLKDMGVFRLCTIFIFALFFLPIFSNAAIGRSYHAPPLQNPQQEYLLTGTVTDSYGPLPGVHILIKGTDTGTLSDKQGEFSLTVQASNTLVFSYIGYKTLEMSVLGRNTLEVELMPEATQLQEVEVNAGYYTVKERERTGSISRVTAEEIELQPVINPIQALQGRMAGVVVTQSTSIPGSVSKIQIRGQNSLRNGGNYPLYIIDGVPINSTPITGSGLVALGIDPLNTLNLSNIYSIEVLKDADATSIYGSRGANGVILITTKKENLGKTTFDMALYSGIGKISNRIDVLNTDQYLEMRKEAFANDDVIPSQSNATDLLLWDQNSDTNWQKKLLGGTAYINDFQFAVSGGNVQTSFVLGNSIHRETLIFPGDFGYRKVTGSAGLNHNSMDDKLKISFSADYGLDKNKLFYDGQYIQRSVLLPPNAPNIYNEDGSLNWENSTWTNPLSYLKKTHEIKSNNLIANTTLSYELTPGLIFKSNFGYVNLANESLSKNPISSNNPAIHSILENSSTHWSVKRHSIIAEPQMLYNFHIGVHRVETIAGLTIQQSNEENSMLFANGYTDESLMGNIAMAERVDILSQDRIKYKYSAIFGRIGYNWNQTYFLNLTGRRDGSSRFSPRNRFANFGAVGIAWIFSNENFVKEGLPFLNFGKLRGSYGTTGSDQIEDYGYLGVYEPTSGEGGLYPVQIGNPDYSWEVNKKIDLSISLGFLRNRILSSINWYRNLSSNQLVGFYLPAITGFNSIQANLPATVENKGWEIELTTQNIKGNKVIWSTSFNLTIPENKLLKFKDLEQSTYANTYKVGESLFSSFLYKSMGVDPETGLYRMLDVNEDGTYSMDDRIVVGDFGREYYGGMNNSLTLGNFQFDFFLEFVKQKGKNQFSMFGTLPGRLGLSGGNQPVEVMDRWQSPGSISNIQRYSVNEANSAYQRAAISDLSISNASYLRLKTLTFSYTLPEISLARTGLESIKFNLHGQNLLTASDFVGFDPEANRGSLLSLPPLRTVTLGIQLKF